MDYTLVITLLGTLEERERAKARGGESEIIVLQLYKAIRSSYEVVTRNLLIACISSLIDLLFLL